jgi:hypothetical protein
MEYGVWSMEQFGLGIGMLNVETFAAAGSFELRA